MKTIKNHLVLTLVLASGLHFVGYQTSAQARLSPQQLQSLQNLINMPCMNDGTCFEKGKNTMNRVMQLLNRLPGEYKINMPLTREQRRYAQDYISPREGARYVCQNFVAPDVARKFNKRELKLVGVIAPIQWPSGERAYLRASMACTFIELSGAQ